MIGQTIQAVAGPILSGGESVLHVDGNTILVANAVPGDLLEIHISTKRRGVLRGEIVKLLEPSPDRIESNCSVAKQCGGCALQYLTGEKQAELKSDWVQAAFKALITAETKWLPALFHQGRYRRRVRWFVGCDGQGEFLGFYARTSHSPVRHTACMVLTPELNKLRQLLEDSSSLGGIHAVQAIQLSDGIHAIFETDSMPNIETNSEVDSYPVQYWWRDCDGITRPLTKPVAEFHDLLPAGEKVMSLAVAPDDFVQGQLEGNCELVTQVQLWGGKPGRVCDLFCGIGNLSLPLAVATGAEVFGAELSKASVRAATASAERLGVTGAFKVANLFETFDIEPYVGADILILDPPRRGAKRICSQISRLLPAKIIMISCDVAAGARDGEILQRQGYKLKALRALDLFPGAGHVEAMSLWVL